MKSISLTHIQRIGLVEWRIGTIKSVQGPHLMILVDGTKYPKPFHPTWRLRYLDAEPALSIEDRVHLEVTGHLPEDF